jgi:hypothetical protein
MVSVLLSRELQTHRVDGSGGDGGKDCYFSDDDGTDVYELKSFTGRMTQTRRRQIKQSLARAMEQAPRSWTLVVPIDATPSEQAWMSGSGGRRASLPPCSDQPAGHRLPAAVRTASCGPSGASAVSRSCPAVRVVTGGWLRSVVPGAAVGWPRSS